MLNEKATKLFVDEKNDLQKLSLELDDKITESVELNDPTIPVNLTPSAFLMLKDLVSKDAVKLVGFANEYQNSSRQFYSFMYDLVALIKYLDKLPTKFHKLTKLEGNADILMHNRVVAEIACFYDKKEHTVDLEIPNLDGKVPDLNIDGKKTEIKTIISPVQNNQESFLEFSKSLRNRHGEARQQVGDNGVIFVAPWSHAMNSIFHEYFSSRISARPPNLEDKKTILTLEGPQSFEDHYSVFNSDDICEEIYQFAQSGYKRISSYAYLGIIRRSGFPLSRQSRASNNNLGVVFKIG